MTKGTMAVEIMNPFPTGDEKIYVDVRADLAPAIPELREPECYITAVLYNGKDISVILGMPELERLTEKIVKRYYG